MQKKILGNVEIQHRVLEEMPILHAVPGFADVHGRRLSDEEVRMKGTGDWVRDMHVFMHAVRMQYEIP